MDGVGLMGVNLPIVGVKNLTTVADYNTKIVLSSVGYINICK